MLVQGSINSQKEEILLNKYKEFINSGVNAEEILVLKLNPYKKNIFYEKLIKEIPEDKLKNHKIMTLYGLSYNSFYDNKEYIKKLIKTDDDKEINLCGLEVSQYIFKKSIKEADFSDYISKVNLLHQLFRRYSLIVQNNLSNEEIVKRSCILKESFYKDAQKAINDYKVKTIEYRSFDYLRQLAILPLIQKDTDYFKGIKYLMADDADEMPYILFQFIYNLIPQLDDYIIIYDKYGSTRSGYLCAYKGGINELKKRFSPKEIILKDNSYFKQTAQTLYENIKNGKKTDISEFKYINTTKRLEMADIVIEDIKKLINSGVNPNNIALITPVADEVLIQYLTNNNFGINFQIISGNTKLAEIKIIKYIISMLKIANSIKINDYELKSLLVEFLKIPYRKCFKIIEKYKKTNELIKSEFDNEIYSEKYIKLLSIIKSINPEIHSLTEQIKIIRSNLLEIETEEEIKKYDFFIKEAQSFETAFSSSSESIVTDFINQTENSIISENPVNSFSLKENSVILSSIQKLSDYEINTDYQMWLDVSNCDWFKQDTGTLYNSWVFNKDWNKNTYSSEDCIKLTREKTAATVRKLILCANKEIRFYSSIYDNFGNENFSGLSDFLEIRKQTKKEYNITPRDDQKPVLEYKEGKMAVTAVPGAGKTTILLSLIIKLLTSGVNPNNIFVLTYMESAAKNFKDKIKQYFDESNVMPNISTIHGLALRIIKENGNYIKMGLDEDFDICDDIIKEKIIKEIFYKLKIPDEKYENYLKSISIVKLSGLNKEFKSKYSDIQEFYNFLKLYNQTLKQKNLIDYDDMLKYSVLILKTDKETREYYQNLCKYIIEDEAQDSTDIQQSLINILSQKHKNIVRCGDINQSITSTFTNSNLESFKKFINENKKVEMTSSQRCAKPIYELANKMIKAAQTNDNTKNAFYNISVKGTPNNPKDNKEPEYIVFDSEKEEKTFILNKIKEIKKNTPCSSIAILTRLNSQVNDYNEFLNSNGIKTAVRTDCLAQKRIYKYIFAVLKIIENPLNNDLITDLIELYSNNYAKNIKEDAQEYIKTLKSPFININEDDIQNELLVQIYWDINYWLNNSTLPIDETALKIGLFYSKNITDKSNTYLISTFIKRIKNENESTDELLKKLNYNSQRPLSAYKFFDDNLQDENNINVMTMHKSKGDEFDYVFIPQLNEDNYSISKENVKIKSSGHFLEAVKNSIYNCGIKSVEQLKKEQIEETLRLLYVGVTRAKRELYLTTAKKYQKRRNTCECDFFINLCNYSNKINVI